MTLILALANSENAVLISDRRLASDRKTTDNESNKASVFMCADARLAVSFTGLAEAGTFKTRKWLAEALSDCAKPDYRMGPTIHRLASRASKDRGEEILDVDQMISRG